MRILSLSCAINLGIAATLLAGCGTLPVSPVGSRLTQEDTGRNALYRAATPEYQLLHAFKSHSDGMHPEAPLISVDGTLYGTTTGGGSAGAGTVYDITTTGREKVLHNFGHGSDGAGPSGGLIDVDGELYSTTGAGGSFKNASCSAGCGTVYQISTTGAEKVLHSFTFGANGWSPQGGLDDVGGTLYGVTAYGGSGCGSTGCGTLFRITTGGSESAIYRFKGGSAGADLPESKLAHIKNTLYGTTNLGGSRDCYYHNGCGTVFSITTAGKENWLYSFKGGRDGSYPDAGLVNVSDTLYGTTSAGGGHADFGTVYNISTLGSEKVVHGFKAGRHPHDGFDPETGLIDVNGTLYGTTLQGGAYNAGTIFSISTTGEVKVLYAFRGSPSDGLYPQGDLVYVHGTLYGTTYYGGGGGKGTCCGTVFALTL